MNHQTFSLQPFPSSQNLPNLEITGNIARHANLLSLTYKLLGDLTEVEIISDIAKPSAVSSETPARKHGLWNNTCFEFFLGIKNSEQYWEFNLSPRGHWNVYRFDGYRKGMQEELALTKLPYSGIHQEDSLVLLLNVDLDKILLADQTLDVAITTVIKTKDGEVSYWALTHKGTEADFHRRDSFIIEV